MEQSEGKCDCNLSFWAATTKQHWTIWIYIYSNLGLLIDWHVLQLACPEIQRLRSLASSGKHLLLDEVRWYNCVLLWLNNWLYELFCAFCQTECIKNIKMLLFSSKIVFIWRYYSPSTLSKNDNYLHTLKNKLLVDLKPREAESRSLFPCIQMMLPNK